MGLKKKIFEKNIFENLYIRLGSLKAIYIPTRSANRSDCDRLGQVVMFQIEIAKIDIHFGDSLIYHPITTFSIDQSVRLRSLRIGTNVSDWDRLGRYIYVYMVHIRASGEIFFEQVREFGFREFFLGTIFRFRVSFGTKKKNFSKKYF